MANQMRVTHALRMLSDHGMRAHTHTHTTTTLITGAIHTQTCTRNLPLLTFHIFPQTTCLVQALPGVPRYQGDKA